ncbi:Kelch-like protein 1 [Eumeta japonica]|uniref:Kelch-like protein 1 n=1 Tax=Eumeta variegata TaxID=151549 RepID=A0A4C2A101_EUMVA|nr:Kelch-like protein 1 [Eumeta japonica]
MVVWEFRKVITKLNAKEIDYELQRRYGVVSSCAQDFYINWEVKKFGLCVGCPSVGVCVCVDGTPRLVHDAPAASRRASDTRRTYTRTWTQIAPMSVPRRWPSAAALGGRVYAVGGSDVKDRVLASGEVYDPRRPSARAERLEHSELMSRVDTVRGDTAARPRVTIPPSTRAHVGERRQRDVFQATLPLCSDASISCGRRAQSGDRRQTVRKYIVISDVSLTPV